MSKVKTAFFCSNCGYESAKWLGKCPACNQWNTFVEEMIAKPAKTDNGWKSYNDEPNFTKAVSLSEISATEQKRLLSTDAELNRVLGGGIVKGSIVLVAGEPGIGKSTLFLQNALQMTDVTTLYVSGEESEQQIKMRADRLKVNNDQFYLLTETITQTIFPGN